MWLMRSHQRFTQWPDTDQVTRHHPNQQWGHSACDVWIRERWVNFARLSDSYMCQKARPSLVEIVAAAWPECKATIWNNDLFLIFTFGNISNQIRMKFKRNRKRQVQQFSCNKTQQTMLNILAIIISASSCYRQCWIMKIDHMINIKQVNTFADYLNKFNSLSPGEYGFRGSHHRFQVITLYQVGTVLLSELWRHLKNEKYYKIRECRWFYLGTHLLRWLQVNISISDTAYFVDPLTSC